MPYAETDLVMISALQHWSYCPRQCGLIHLEQTFDENLYTLRGRFVHEKVDEPETRFEDGLRVERALPLFSDRLGLVGKADLVEFHSRPNAPDVAFPVEYKHGARKTARHDDVQLCAQAMCLEEMTGQAVPEGAVYHFGSRRRRKVEFSPALRTRVEDVVRQVRDMLRSQSLPVAPDDKRCENCSLLHSCLPSVVAQSHRLRRLARSLFVPAPVGD